MCPPLGRYRRNQTTVWHTHTLRTSHKQAWHPTFFSHYGVATSTGCGALWHPYSNNISAPGQKVRQYCYSTPLTNQPTHHYAARPAVRHTYTRTGHSRAKRQCGTRGNCGRFKAAAAPPWPLAGLLVHGTTNPHGNHAGGAQGARAECIATTVTMCQQRYNLHVYTCTWRSLVAYVVVAPGPQDLIRSRNGHPPHGPGVGHPHAASHQTQGAAWAGCLSRWGAGGGARGPQGRVQSPPPLPPLYCHSGNPS